MIDRRIFLSRMETFARDETGAATVDWVVGTAAAVTMGLAVMETVGNGVEGLADRVSEHIANIEFDWSKENAPPPTNGSDG
jgi:Flp pilus assembly pilin Flp